MKKLMSHITYIQIGHNNLIFFIFILLLFQSCGWFGEPEEVVNMTIKNTTSDTLIVNFYNGSFIGINDIKRHIIFANSFTIMEEAVTIHQDDDPIKEHFNQWNYHDSCWVYYYDNELRNIVENQIDTFSGMITPNPKSLRIFWKGPFREMGDSMNNFFNKQSWRSEGEYEILFTISESDYNVKK